MAETLKQYEMNQADNKESLAIALEEKLEEIAKMISSLSDRIDHLSARLNSIEEKVDNLSARREDEAVTPEADAAQIPEPVFDSLLENGFEEEEEDDEFEYEPEEEAEEETETPNVDNDSDVDTVEDTEEEEENVEEAEEVEEEEEIENEEDSEEAEEEDDNDAEGDDVEESDTESEDEENEAENDKEEVEEEEIAEEKEIPEAEKKEKDWYDWEYDYPAEYVDDILGTMGINDKLEFVRELFHSDPALFNQQMTEIDTMPNFKAIVQYFRQAHPEWKEDSDTVYRLYMHIRRKFRN